MKLRCLIRGDPYPVVYWLHNGQRVVKSAKYVLRQRSFIIVIRKFSEEDAGKYTCVGSNSAGRVNMTYTVMAAKKPTAAPFSSSVVTVIKGHNITLTCEVPNSQVRYLLWNPPNKTPRTRLVPGGFRTGSIDQDMRRRKKPLLEKRYVRNHTRFQEKTLLNVTKEIHEVVTVKTIQVVVTTGIFK